MSEQILVITGTRKDRTGPQNITSSKAKSHRMQRERPRLAKKTIIISRSIYRTKRSCPMARSIKANFGSINGLINNAGIASMNHSLLTPASTISKANTNVLGTFLLCREIARLMRKTKRGRIVNYDCCPSAKP